MNWCKYAEMEFERHVCQILFDEDDDDKGYRVRIIVKKGDLGYLLFGRVSSLEEAISLAGAAPLPTDALRNETIHFRRRTFASMTPKEAQRAYSVPSRSWEIETTKFTGNGRLYVAVDEMQGWFDNEQKRVASAGAA